MARVLKLKKYSITSGKACTNSQILYELDLLFHTVHALIGALAIMI